MALGFIIELIYLLTVVDLLCVNLCVTQDNTLPNRLGRFFKV